MIPIRVWTADQRAPVVEVWIDAKDIQYMHYAPHREGVTWIKMTSCTLEVIDSPQEILDLLQLEILDNYPLSIFTSDTVDKYDLSGVAK